MRETAMKSKSRGPRPDDVDLNARALKALGDHRGPMTAATVRSIVKRHGGYLPSNPGSIAYALSLASAGVRVREARGEGARKPSREAPRPRPRGPGDPGWGEDQARRRRLAAALNDL